MASELMVAESAALAVELPPGEDELPYDDGEPMESQRHVLQMTLLIETLSMHWEGRETGFVGGNMFVYFSAEQVKGHHFRGPDFFAVLDAPRRERKSWVVWQEGRGPDVVIELLSETTARFDRTEKKRIYQDQVRVPEYYWYDPFTGELAGFVLHGGRYRPMEPDEQGRLASAVLELVLVRREGSYRGVEADWLRWSTPEGTVLPTGEELAREAEELAREAEARAGEAEARAGEAEARAGEAEEALLREAGARRRLEEELERLRRGPVP